MKGKCTICGSDKNVRNFQGKQVLCGKHREQMRKHGKIREALEAEETVGGYFVPYAFMENVEKLISQAIQAARIEAKEEERKRIADSIGSFPLRDYMFFDESNWEAGYKALWEFKQSIINNHQ